MLFKTLKECNSVVTLLSLSQNQIDDGCMKQLGEFVKENQYLESLFVDDNEITDKGVKTLADCIVGNTILKQLSFQSNKDITNASVPNLIELVKGSFITEIGISKTSITEDAMRAIEEALKIPMDQREIPIKSMRKSAAKVSVSAST